VGKDEARCTDAHQIGRIVDASASASVWAGGDARALISWSWDRSETSNTPNINTVRYYLPRAASGVARVLHLIA
jgi:hypothetical protein